MNTSGKTQTIFLVVIVILLLSLSAITLFFFQKESELRKSAEATLSEIKNNEAKIQTELKEAKKQVFLLEERNKEADEKINDLMDNLELEQGLRDEMKTENTSLREALDTENKSKEQLREALAADLTSAQQKVKELENALAAEQARAKDLENDKQSLQEKMKQMEIDFNAKLEEEANKPSPPAEPSPVPSENQNQSKANPEADPEIKLDKIVVAPTEMPEGRVLSVDKENEFLIFNLGQKQGIAQGLVVSIYRGEDYLGDVRVTRVQPEMSAADFIPPFSSQRVRKNDQVVIKK